METAARINCTSISCGTTFSESQYFQISYIKSHVLTDEMHKRLFKQIDTLTNGNVYVILRIYILKGQKQLIKKGKKSMN